MTFEEVLSGAFLVFCRIGGCVMIAPAFSLPQAPTRVRLFIALGVSGALTPLLLGKLEPIVVGAGLSKIILASLCEIGVGCVFGLMARIVILCIETFAMTIVASIGLSSVFGPSLTEDEPLPALVTLISVGALAMIFATDQHLQLIRGLVATYDVTAPFTLPDARAMTIDFAEILQRCFVALLRISSPFLLLGLIMNLAFGFLSRLVPAAPAYFISVPAVMLVGFYMLSNMIAPMLIAISDVIGDWLK